MKNEGIGNLPGYSKYMEDQKLSLESLLQGFPSRKEYLAWKIEFTHLIFGKEGIQTFELLTDEVLEPFFYGDLKEKDNARFLRFRIADALRKDCLSEANARFSQRAQEINIPEKKNQYKSEVMD